MNKKHYFIVLECWVGETVQLDMKRFDSSIIIVFCIFKGVCWLWEVLGVTVNVNFMHNFFRDHMLQEKETFVEVS